MKEQPRKIELDTFLAEVRCRCGWHHVVRVVDLINWAREALLALGGKGREVHADELVEWPWRMDQLVYCGHGIYGTPPSPLQGERVEAVPVDLTEDRKAYTEAIGAFARAMLAKMGEKAAAGYSGWTLPTARHTEEVRSRAWADMQRLSRGDDAQAVDVGNWAMMLWAASQAEQKKGGTEG